MPRRIAPSPEEPKRLDTYAALALEDASVRLVVAKDNPSRLQVIADEEIPVDGDYGSPGTNVEVVEFVSQTLAGLPGLELAGVGISAPGIIDNEKKSVRGLSRHSSKRDDRLQNWPTISFGDTFDPWISRQRQRIVVGNDAAMSALGESWHRRDPAAPEDDNFAYIRIGTGVNAAFMIDGAPVTTEFAHMSVSTVEGDLEKIRSLCPYHKSCLEGRAGYERLEQLASEIGWDKTEDIAATYIAGIFHMVTLLFPPVILVAQTIPKKRGETFLDKIRAVLTERTAQYPGIKNPKT
jgi:predicted NBD/HSP70 family sugar kinase